jgi:hypothetical protein
MMKFNFHKFDAETSKDQKIQEYHKKNYNVKIFNDILVIM